MKLEFPLTPEKIREGMEKVISSIREETNWDLQRTLSDVTIEIGEAPELGYSFGVNEVKNKLVFANWLVKIEPEITRRKIWEFIIIRESMSLFIKEELLENQISELTRLFLNIMAMAYQQNMYEGKSFESEYQILKARFLYITIAEKALTQQLDKEIDSLLTTIITQGITYKLIHNTYLHFTEDIPLNEIDVEELVYDFYRYMSSSPEEIAAPIQFKDSIVIVINELINIGHLGSAVAIAKNLRLNHSTVTKHLTKIVSRYSATWKRESNWQMLGLHSYLFLIEAKKQDTPTISDLAKKIQEIPYVVELFEGENADYIYLYSVIHCPHSVADNFSFTLEKLQNDKLINSFIIKPIQRRVYKTAFVHPKIKPVLSNYDKMIAGKMPVQKFTLWDNKKFLKPQKDGLKESDKKLVKFLSILIEKSITTKGYFGVWISELSDFLKENNIDPNDTLEGTNFFNELQKQALESVLLDFRLSISPSILYSHEKLIVRIFCDPLSDSTYRLIDDLSIFGWMVILSSYEEIFLVINGLNYQDPLAELIVNFLDEKKLKFDIFSIKSRFSQYVPYDELYDFKNNKWKI